MQKFKATREEIMKAYKNIAGYDNTVWVLEGELLEGGTVEKCCEVCRGGPKLCMDCRCHNKKEEQVCTLRGCRCFNRETHKEEVQLPEMLVIDGVKASNQALENDKHLAEKINQILAYLASKENK